MFRDRTEAGCKLGERLLRFKAKHPLVLALPRGGVAVAFEIARMLAAQLDVVLVRKIGAPMQPELAIGAIADGEHPETVVNRDVVDALGIPVSYLEEERERQLTEIERRRKLYLAGRPRPTIAGKTVIVVDDGIATGATMRAALRAVRRAGPKRLVLAVPISSAQAISELQHDVDDVECLELPEDLWAIGGHYEDFTQVTDSDVTTMLQEAARFVEAESSGSPCGGKTRA